MVCPPIVVPVWLEHLERYAPAMRVVANTAGGRRGGKGSTNPDTKTMETADVVVTTYSCVSRRAALRNVEEWGGVLLDENHLAPRSGTFTTWLSSCKARCKWGLSADRAAVRQSVFTMLRNPVTFFGGRIVDCIDFDACWTVAPKLEYEDGTPLLSLPAPTLVQHTLPFASSDERLMYRQIGAHVLEAWRSRPPDSLFWMVNRALSYHPFKAADLLVGPGGADPLEACLTTDMSKALKLDGDAGQHECAVCMSPLAHAVAPAGCSHAFCKPCLAAWMRRNDSCPLCRSRITQVRLVTIDDVVVGGPSATDDVKGGGLSTTKLAAVMDLITGGREGDKFLLGASSPASV
ncbi:MAG: RING finger domain-containing protein, partial [Bacteroidota bacterium]|nr:RING finger domain-containing protein [Bacteroidota bacterium]